MERSCTGFVSAIARFLSSHPGKFDAFAIPKGQLAQKTASEAADFVFKPAPPAVFGQNFAKSGLRPTIFLRIEYFFGGRFAGFCAKWGVLHAPPELL